MKRLLAVLCVLEIMLQPVAALEWIGCARAEGVTTPTDLCDHSWPEGVCVKCGTVCVHLGTVNIVRTKYITRTEDDDNRYHYRYRQDYIEVLCTTCNSILDYYFDSENLDYRENHFYQDGECSICGHINSCAHENTVVDRFVYGECTYEEYDDKQIQCQSLPSGKLFHCQRW